MSGDDLLNQAEIEKLLAQAKQHPSPEGGAQPSGDSDRPLDQSEIESLLNSAKSSPTAQPAASVAGPHEQDAD